MTDYFVPRNREIQQLESVFKPLPQSNQRSLFVVYGLGGIGKTQLCADFARRNYGHFSAVLWLDGTSKDALRQSLADAAYRIPNYQATEWLHTSQVNVQETVEILLRWLSRSGNTQWLLIFDSINKSWPSADP